MSRYTFARVASATGSAACLLALAIVLGACAAEFWTREPRGALTETSGPSALDGLVYVVADLDDPRRLDLWRARLSDGAVQPLTQTPDRREEIPVWSERASALVFQTRSPYSWRSPTRLVLWRAGSEQELPGERANVEAEASWAPFDSRLVYVVRMLRPPDTEEVVRSGVTVVDMETGEQAILAHGSSRDSYSRPSFSPDGRRVVAEYRIGRDNATQLALLGVEKEPQLLTDGAYHAVEPSFTRDGRHILFSKRLDRRGPRDVMWMKSDGSDLQVLASTSESDDFEATASPTRDEVAFVSDRDGKPDLFLVDLESGTVRNLTASLARGMSTPRWSPDGEHIAVTAWAKEESSRFTADTVRVLVLDREGRVVFEVFGMYPDWMPPWG